MSIFLLLLCVVLVFFAVVLLVGAPYVPTLSKNVEQALDLLDLKPGQTMLELGCGDGRLLKAAAKRGIYGVGYELNPLLYIIARVWTWRYRRFIKIYCRNYWKKTWPPADGMYVFLLQRYMKKLHTTITHYSSKSVPFRVVSFAFVIHQKKPIKEIAGMRLYIYEK